jgi:SAM-dependent methyltransferase
VADRSGQVPADHEHATGSGAAGPTAADGVGTGPSDRDGAGMPGVGTPGPRAAGPAAGGVDPAPVAARAVGPRTERRRPATGDADRLRWDARHARAGGTVAVPPDALRGREHLLPGSGRVLDVACGRGGVAVWFARRGWRVDAVDVSPVGVAAGAEAAPEVSWHVHDLGSGLPAACAGPYEVVVCQRFREPALYPALAAALAPGGLLVLTVLSAVGDSGGPYRAAPGELAAAFPDLHHLVHTERDGEATLLARRRL